MEHNSFIVSSSNTNKYHGGLVLHPSSNPSVNVNDDCEAVLKFVMTDEQAKSVIAQRKVKKFESLKELREHLNGKGLERKLNDEEIIFV